MSEPTGRMSSPGRAARLMRTRRSPPGPASSFSVSSTCTTASAPGGTGAPAKACRERHGIFKVHRIPPDPRASHMRPHSMSGGGHGHEYGEAVWRHGCCCDCRFSLLEGHVVLERAWQDATSMPKGPYPW